LLALDTADIAIIRQEKEKMSKVGEIVIKVYRGSTGVPTVCTMKEVKGLANAYDNLIHENSLKGEAKSHSTSYIYLWLDIKPHAEIKYSLGPAETTGINTNVHFDKLDGQYYPIAIYKFRYRSKGKDYRNFPQN
jgi:hypothetical protein